MVEGDIALFLPKTSSKKEKRFVYDVIRRSKKSARLQTMLIINNNAYGVHLISRIIQKFKAPERFTTYFIGRLILPNELRLEQDEILQKIPKRVRKTTMARLQGKPGIPLQPAYETALQGSPSKKEKP